MRGGIPFLCFILLLTVAGLSACNRNDAIESKKKETVYLLHKIFDLPSEVCESSGIIVYDSLLWTFNDSGNEPVLYGLDVVEGTIRKILTLLDAENVDWEDITQDSHSVYIGDFGNNNGTRKDLCIYKISKAEVDNSYEQRISADRIAFNYTDQTDFTYNFHNTSYDCEALLFDGDSLVLFTKNWQDNTTVLYKLPTVSGSFHTKKFCELNSEGFITGADLNLTNNQLVLCGYYYLPFVMIIDDFRKIGSKDPGIRRYDLNNDLYLQLEGVTSFDEQILLSSENAGDIQALYRFIEQ
ncbi:MAG: hypothetical protein JXB24_11120 [Bacteroidales bacterium]|nr:hypothetical protein [Bacteroidales bacterium]